MHAQLPIKDRFQGIMYLSSPSKLSVSVVCGPDFGHPRQVSSIPSRLRMCTGDSLGFQPFFFGRTGLGSGILRQERTFDCR